MEPTAPPMAAALLSLVVPGLGQAFNGRRLRGLLFLLTFWLFIPWLIAPVDAYISAKSVTMPIGERVRSAALFAGLAALIAALGMIAALPR